jgi:hypothetical protein
VSPDKFIIVWRPAEGAAVQTYAELDKSPRVFTSVESPEASAADEVDLDTLAVLLENREEFHPKRVKVAAARSLLGWNV